MVDVTHTYVALVAWVTQLGVALFPLEFCFVSGVVETIEFILLGL